VALQRSLDVPQWTTVTLPVRFAYACSPKQQGYPKRLNPNQFPSRNPRQISPKTQNPLKRPSNSHQTRTAYSRPQWRSCQRDYCNSFKHAPPKCARAAPARRERNIGTSNAGVQLASFVVIIGAAAESVF
jgi:hypothetical protein